MKIQFTKPTQLGLTVLLGLLGNARGIERPGEVPAEVVVPAQDEAADEGEVAKKPLEIKQAFLGVSGDPVSDDLAWHLNLEGGLQLNFVLDDSPADLAGIIERDIVTSIDGKPLSSQDELRAAVLAKAPGEEIVLKLVRRGRPIEQKVKLSERAAMPARAQRVNPFPGDLGRDNFEKNLDRRLGEGPGNHLDIQRQLLKEVEKAWGLNGGNGPMQLKLKLDDLLDEQVGVKTAGSVMFQDQDGSVEMRMTDGAREITIRDIEGKIVFEGPYDSGADKAAVPEQYQERVEKLGLDEQGSGRMFHFEFNKEKEKK
ncbi:S1C family serine protease [Akkermansiaceae bacterium]|nr:S1C family serine protease [Akkermansiaceae bacterium]